MSNDRHTPPFQRLTREKKIDGSIGSIFSFFIPSFDNGKQFQKNDSDLLPALPQKQFQSIEIKSM